MGKPEPPPFCRPLFQWAFWAPETRPRSVRGISSQCPAPPIAPKKRVGRATFCICFPSRHRKSPRTGVQPGAIRSPGICPGLPAQRIENKGEGRYHRLRESVIDIIALFGFMVLFIDIKKKLAFLQEVCLNERPPE